MCRYAEIRDLYIKQLTFTWMEDSTAEATGASVNEQIKIFAKKAPEHATEIVLAFLKIAEEDGNTTSLAHTESLFVSSTQCRPLLGLMLSARFTLSGQCDAGYELCRKGVCKGGAD